MHKPARARLRQPVRPLITPHIRISDINAPLVVTQLSEPIHTLRQSADGTPFVSYFAEQTSFCWTGDPGEPIEVSSGYSGAPVTAFIEMPVEPARATLAEHAALFKEVCDQYLSDVDVDVEIQ